MLGRVGQGWLRGPGRFSGFLGFKAIVLQEGQDQVAKV